MFILKHKWHPEHRKFIFHSIDGIRNIENVYFKPYMASGTQKMLILKPKWYPEHRNAFFKTQMVSGT